VVGSLRLALVVLIVVLPLLEYSVLSTPALSAERDERLVGLVVVVASTRGECIVVLAYYYEHRLLRAHQMNVKNRHVNKMANLAPILPQPGCRCCTGQCCIVCMMLLFISLQDYGQLSSRSKKQVSVVVQEPTGHDGTPLLCSVHPDVQNMQPPCIMHPPLSFIRILGLWSLKLDDNLDLYHHETL
jgi:hypothetical protein